MKELIQKTREYLDYVEKHYDNVQKAWLELSTKCVGHNFMFIKDSDVNKQISRNIEIHDKSKLSKEEFIQYRERFFQTRAEKDAGIKINYIFQNAWENHLLENPHHWQTWTKLDDENEQYIFFIENICDWIAIGYEFGDDAKQYYEKNKHNINLPDWAVHEMYRIFDVIYG